MCPGPGFCLRVKADSMVCACYLMESIQEDWTEIPNEALSALSTPKPPLELFSRSGLAGSSLMLGRQTKCLAPWRADKVEVQPPS